VVQFHEQHQVRLAQSFANHAFELWKRRRGRCPFRECNYVRMAYCSFDRCQYLVEWRDEIRLNRSTSTVAIIPTTFPATLDNRAEYLGPVFLEAGVALQPAFQHGSYTVLRFGPPQRFPKRSKGVEESIERRQRDFVDEMLSRNESAPIEGADPTCEGIDEAVQLGVRKGSVHIAVSFRCVAIEVVGTQNDFERPPASHQVRKAPCASAARMQVDSEFRVTELRVLMRGEAHVAGKNELAAHAAHTAPDSYDADDRRLG
jgi:hypothetical protein